MARARSASGRAAAKLPRPRSTPARVFRALPTSGWSGPYAVSAMARARSSRGRLVVSRQEAVEFVRQRTSFSDLLLAAPEFPQVDSEVVHRLLQRIAIPLGV